MGLGLELYHGLSWVSSLPTADLGTPQSIRLHEPIPYNKSLFIDILLFLSLWRFLTNMVPIISLFVFNKFIYLFLATLGLCCCARAFSSCSEWGYSSLRCTGFSLRWLHLLQSMGSRCTGFSSCGSRALELRLSSCGARALLLRGMWDLPRPGLSNPRPLRWQADS